MCELLLVPSSDLSLSLSLSLYIYIYIYNGIGKMISFGYTYFRNVLLAIFCTSLALFVQCRYECTAANVITVQLSQILEITIVWDLMLFTNVSEETTVSICLSSSTMKMEALISSRMSVNSFQTTWNYITDDINLRGHCCSP